MHSKRNQYTSNGQNNVQPKETTTVLKRAAEIPARVLPLKTIKNLFELPINLPVMNAIWRERRELEQLTDEHIKDIGLNPEAVRLEANRSFFDIPEERRKSYWKNTRSNYCETRYEKCF